MDDKKYLEPDTSLIRAIFHMLTNAGFEPEKLTMPQLRNIFVAHNVDYPSAARKADLVNIFKEHIAPQAAKLLAEAASVTPHDIGIVDAPKKKSRSPSKRKKASEEPAVEEPAEEPASPTRRRTRTASPSPKKPLRSKKSEDVVAEEKTAVKLSDVKLAPPDLAADIPKSPSSPRRRARKTNITDPASVAKYVPDPVDQKAPISFVGTKRKTAEEEVKESNEATAPESRRKSFSPINVFQQSSTAKQEETTASEADTSVTPESKSRSSLSPKNYFQSTPALAKKGKKRSSVGPSSASKKLHTETEETTPERDGDTGISNDTTTSFSSYETPTKYHTVSGEAPKTEPRKLKSALRKSFGTIPAPQTDVKSRSERLSFMPELSSLKVSQEFSKTLSSLKHSNESNNNELAQESPIRKDEKPQSPSQIDAKIAELEDHIVKEQKKKNRKKLVRKSTKPWKKWFKSAFVNLFRLFLLSSIVLYVIWWRKEKFSAGYCDVELSSRPPSEEPIDKALDYIRPGCTICPENAKCYPHFQVSCDEGYLYVRNPLSFGEFFPLAPTCVPDSQRERRVMLFEEKIYDILRSRNARAECGETDEAASIETESLKQTIYDMKAPSLSSEKFEDLWTAALERVKGSDEIIVRTVSDIETWWNEENQKSEEYVHQKEMVQSTSLANISLNCRFRLQVRGTLARYRKEINATLSTLVLLLLAGIWLKKQRRKQHLVATVVKESLNQLIAQQQKSDGDLRGITPRFLATMHLRERFPNLQNGQNTSIWKDVQKNIEDNANVRVRQIEIGGEIMRVWEWVGGAMNL